MKFELELRGARGNEKVKIFKIEGDGKQLNMTYLTVDWQKFSYYSLSGVRVHVAYSVNDPDVYLRNADLYRIEIQNKDDWNCSKKNPNERCKSVEAGNFFWNANYLVTYQGNTYNEFINISLFLG